MTHCARILSALLTASLLPLPSVPAQDATADRPVRLSDQPQLFLDDHIVARTTNLKRELTQPLKHPANPLIVQDRPWEKRLIATYGTVLHDHRTGKFRCWYTAGEHKDGIPDDPNGPVTAEYFLCYAESGDGIHWDKPLVGTGTFGRHKRHNIVIPGGHGFCVLPARNEAHPKRRYLGAGGPLFGFSEDGIHWTTHNWRDAVAKNDTSTSVVRWQDSYLAYVRYQVQDRNWPAVMRGIGLSTSRDFENWTPKELIFKTDEKDGYPWTQPYGLAVTPYGDQLVGILWLLHLDRISGNNSLGDEDTQLVVSRDGRRWQRVADRAGFLAPTPGTWDGGRIHAPTTSMFVKGDVVHIYYSASNTRHGSGSWGSPGIGLATLPADRFVAFGQHDPSVEGVLQTRLLDFSGHSLIVNAETSVAGMRVELVDGSGEVIAGFDRHSSRLLRRDKLRYEVVWEVGAARRSLGDAAETKPLAMRFVLKDRCRLYALQVASE